MPVEYDASLVIVSTLVAVFADLHVVHGRLAYISTSDSEVEQIRRSRVDGIIHLPSF